MRFAQNAAWLVTEKQMSDAASRQHDIDYSQKHECRA